jgi:pyruvate formate lyase activating enzyme
MKEARLYDKLENQKVKCFTCAHRCTISNGKRGICGVMENQKGILVSLVYGKAIAVHVDPIEKKPLFHFYPGSSAFSVATVGCNMRCLNCQNADISQLPRERKQIEGHDVSPEALVQSAQEHQCRIISYTYTEPAVYWDYAFDTAKLAHERGIQNVFVTNGFLSEESLHEIAPYLDGANVDLKFFRDETYKSVCGAKLMPVLDTIRRMKEKNIWIELTTLLIPRLNDSDDELKEIAQFIYKLDPDIPWHVSRFHPTYRMTDRSPTPVASIQRARQIGLEAGLHHVYSGNCPGDKGENTTCSHCGVLLIHRMGFEVVINRIMDGKCPECHTPIRGVWGNR